MFGVLINVGSNSSCQNGRGRVFEDFTFEYLPIPEDKETLDKVPTYKDLGFSHVKFPDVAVHLDPEFETFTYGHVERGFGDVKSILRLRKEDVLFFYATLQNKNSWSPYIIGCFTNLEINDCRNLSIEEIFAFKYRGFGNNAHLRRADPYVDFLIKGGQGSRLLQKAFPLAKSDKPSELRDSFKDIILTATGKKIRSGTPWFRWTLICEKPEVLLRGLS